MNLPEGCVCIFTVYMYCISVFIFVCGQTAEIPSIDEEGENSQTYPSNVS
jgi:hypothetical protein